MDDSIPSRGKERGVLILLANLFCLVIPHIKDDDLIKHILYIWKILSIKKNERKTRK